MGGEDGFYIYSSRLFVDRLLYECYILLFFIIYFIVFVIGKVYDVGWYYFVIYKFNLIFI